MEAEKNRKIEIEKLETSRKLAEEEIQGLQNDLKQSKEELGQAKMLMDSAIAEKDATANQMTALKDHWEVSIQYLINETSDGPIRTESMDPYSEKIFMVFLVESERSRAAG